ncbi:MAG: Ribonuclease BN [Candidatus Anoxychlamydiales bacterium]|nr:Ribonuclease BN [Candidatus Anoxychlamydiales bacterium]
MKLKFLGTRGYIEPKTRRHSNHTSLMVIQNKKKIMIDCGETFKNKLKKINPDHIVITHVHPDHAFGLKNGTNCFVWATKTTWKLIDHFPIDKKYRKIIYPRKKQKIANVTFEAFEVMHSVKAPAVGYRITYNKKAFFYVPDVLWIEKRKAAFKNIIFYIGDGATIQRNMVRKDKATNKLYGHANIRQQLTWCKKENVKKMIITHQGSDIVKNEKKAKKIIEKLAKEREIDFELAFDGMEIDLE